MKNIIILGDGMADLPFEKLGGKTPLDVAKKVNLDNLAKNGEIGLVKTVPDALKPGSDVANLAVLGYDPLKYYTGRSPLEAVSMGINMQNNEIALRCNLVTLSEEGDYENKTMLDYSAGEITTAESKILINAVNEALAEDNIKFYPGISYRHCVIIKDYTIEDDLTPPHDISDKVIAPYLPKGVHCEKYLSLMKKSFDILKNHPINIERKNKNLLPANSIWLWGAGKKPILDSFKNKTGLSGAIISAVDLVKGIGIAAGMKIYEVEGATGNINTNFQGKAQTAIKALKENDFVYLHIEAPDECGHHGDYEGKVKSIEIIDEKVLAPVKAYLDGLNEDYNLMVLPDHPTPLSTKTHSKAPVPYMIYRKNKGKGSGFAYNEKNAEKSGIYIEEGYTLIDKLING